MKKHFKNIKHKKKQDDKILSETKIEIKITGFSIIIAWLIVFCLGILSLYYPLIGAIYIFTSLLVSIVRYFFDKEYKKRLLNFLNE